MATLRHIKRRIESVRSTQQITSAMKMVAAAKLRKVQQNLMKSRPYAHELVQVIGHVTAMGKRKRHPLLASRNGDKVCYVLITADKGLCGSFNTNLIRQANHEWNNSEAEEKYLITIGRKGYEHFKRRDFPIMEHYEDIFDSLDFSKAQTISTNLIRYFTSHKVDRVYIIYQEFKSAIQQIMKVEQFLPIEPVVPDKERFPANFVFEPNASVVLSELIPQMLAVQIWKCLLESSTSEMGSKMTAMETATENAGEMINELVLYYNKARQAAITNELNEIVSGAEALKG